MIHRFFPLQKLQTILIQFPTTCILQLHTQQSARGSYQLLYLTQLLKQAFKLDFNVIVGFPYSTQYVWNINLHSNKLSDLCSHHLMTFSVAASVGRASTPTQAEAWYHWHRLPYTSSHNCILTGIRSGYHSITSCTRWTWWSSHFAVHPPWNYYQASWCSCGPIWCDRSSWNHTLIAAPIETQSVSCRWHTSCWIHWRMLSKADRGGAVRPSSQNWKAFYMN